MPPKRSSGESKQGLVITLVFFILATIGLGVATYFGYSEQEAKDKAKADAEKKLGDMTAERDWYKFQWNLARSYMGLLPGGEATEVGVKKADFDKAQQPGKGQAGFKEAVDTRVAAEKTLGGWNGPQNRPVKTYEELLAQWKSQYEKLETVSKQYQQNLAAAEKRAQELDNELKEARKNYDTQLAAQAKKATEDLATDRKMIESLRGEITKLGAEREKDKNTLVQAEQIKARAEGKQKKAEEELRAKDKQLKDTVESLQQTNARLTALYEKMGVDAQALEKSVLDAKAVEALRNWNENWKIVRLDPRGQMPYINLGSADHVTPQLTFSVHGVGPNGKPLPTVKGTIEVIKVLGDHLSQARVTSAADPNRDPIMKGDMLFNPSWHPTQKKHVALVGLIDLTGDGRDSLPEMMRGLQRQNVEVDAWMDPKDASIQGKGITNQTDYLVVGLGSESLTGARGRDPKFGPAVDKAIKDMKEKAAANGVAIVTLKKYLELIGYQVPRALPEGSTAPSRPRLEPYTPRGAR
jgi:flagellar basal body-associated protein FliL